MRDGHAAVDQIWGPILREVPVHLRSTDDRPAEVRALRPGQIVLLH